MSSANGYCKLGDLRIVMDGCIARVPRPPFFVTPTEVPADQFAFTQGP